MYVDTYDEPEKAVAEPTKERMATANFILFILLYFFVVT